MHRLLVACALLAALAGCDRKLEVPSTDRSGEPDPTPTLAQARVATDGEVLLLGEVGALTGRTATFGRTTHNGIELALKHENAAGGVRGRKVAVRVHDSQGSPEEAARGAERLITSDKVLVLLGEVASTNSIAMAQKAQAAGVPMVTPSSTHLKVTEVGDYVFRVCFVDPFQGHAMARFARGHLGLKAAAVLKDLRSDYSVGLAEDFSRRFAEQGGKVVATRTYSEGDEDFRAALTAIKKARPEALYVPGYYADVGLIARQAKELGLEVVLLGGDGWESPELFGPSGGAVVGGYFTNHYWQGDPSPSVRRFVDEYTATYGAVPDSLAALGYDAARVAIDAMRRASALTGPAIRDALAQTRDFSGVAGAITLDAQRNAVKPAVVLKVGPGDYEFVTAISP